MSEFKFTEDKEVIMRFIFT